MTTILNATFFHLDNNNFRDTIISEREKNN